VRLLGQGGMGAVYLADDTTLDRRVAIKVVSEKLGADSEVRARFLREARAMASVEHPHIVRVYAYGEAEGKAYLVMEYVEGETLAARIRRQGRLPVGESLEILRQVVEALEAAWEKRIVHRDVKPSNILLDQRGRVRVGDFGLAKPLRMAGDATLSQTGYILGTPHYISPEQARGQPVDFRSDIYSLGVVFYEMLVGERPFAGTTPMDVVARHLQEPLPLLSRKRADAPSEVEQLLASMTQKEPAARPASYAGLLERINALLGVTPRTPAPVSGRAPAPRKFPRLKYAGVVALAAVLLSAAWFAWRSWTASQGPTPAAKEKRLVVAVTPFYGPDEDSAKEGRVMAALVEKEITNRLGRENAKVLGIEDTKQSVHDHDAARALGERLGASVVIWGEAFVLRGETEIQPYFTMVRPKAPPTEAPAQTGMQMMAGGQDPLAALQERAAKSVVVEAAAPNQIALRKTSAAGVGDVVLFLAGMHALYMQKNPEKALALFTQAPKTAESLRYRAQALLQLNRKDQAVAALQEAVRIDPHDAQSYAQLGDLEMEAGEFKEAGAAYHSAAEAGGTYTTRQAIFYDGKLYKKDWLRGKFYTERNWHETPYFLGLDPQTGKVRERYRLPGVARSFTVKDNAVQIGYAFSPEGPEKGTITFSRGRFDHPVFYGGGLLLRMNGMRSGWAPTVNFNIASGKFAAATTLYDDAPRTLTELEAALHKAIAQDPTQPWYPFYLGGALWSEGHKDEATKIWQEMFSGTYPGTPYYEFCMMAAFFEWQMGQRQWADRAYAEALKRRQKVPQPIGLTSLIERLINTPFMPRAAFEAQKGTDLERAYLWLLRAREVAGVCLEGDEFAAAAWAKYFREHGDAPRAQHESDYFETVRKMPLNLAEILTELDYALYACLAFSLGCLMLVVMLAAKAVRQRVPTGGPDSGRGLAVVPAVVSAIAPRERVTLALAFLAVLASAALVVPRAHLFLRLSTTDLAVMDSFGSAHFVGESEERFKDQPAEPARYLLAVVNHMAGNTERARELYESLPNDPRAQKNLAALRQGELVPPEPLSAQDLYRALAAKSWKDWVEMLLKPGYVFTLFKKVSDEAPSWPAGVSYFLEGGVLLTALILVTFFFVPYRGCAELLPPKTVVRRRLARAGFFLIPGTYDLRRGSPWRGYVIFTLSAFIVLVALVQLCLYVTRQGPAPGFVAGVAAPNYVRSFPFPTAPGLPDQDAVRAYHYWTIFWAYPYAKLFWTVVALAALISLVLHISRFRRIWKLYEGRG
jgi:cytochrome c-type biogenesis protein CcmH/NrfG/predicted Ser/Thr protein kinase